SAANTSALSAHSTTRMRSVASHGMEGVGGAAAMPVKAVAAAVDGEHAGSEDKELSVNEGDRSTHQGIGRRRRTSDVLQKSGERESRGTGRGRSVPSRKSGHSAGPVAVEAPGEDRHRRPKGGEASRARGKRSSVKTASRNRDPRSNAPQDSKDDNRSPVAEIAGTAGDS
ncbi:unnamed protein product, partial [Sphacelaria rigidula]